MEVKSISVQQLKTMQDEKADFALIDVREQHEYDFVQMGGELIPVSLVPVSLDKFDRDNEKVIVHCRSGARSANVIAQLQQLRGYDNLYNLEGGILAWAREIDTSLPTY